MINGKKMTIGVSALIFLIFIFAGGWIMFQSKKTWREIYESHVYQYGKTLRGNSVVLTDMQGDCSVNNRVAIFDGVPVCWDVIQSFSYYDWNGGNPILLGYKSRVGYRGLINIDLNDGRGSVPFEIDEKVVPIGFENFKFEKSDRAELLFKMLFK